MKKGFTLIELLIVVAIIAILAAIAVPNFLEAQVRSKVSRTRTDMRSLATAIESYYVDNNTYPVGSWGTRYTWSTGVNANYNAALPNAPVSYQTNHVTFGARTGTASQAFGTITTPISYFSSYPTDVFADFRTATFSYKDFTNAWVLVSAGPDLRYCGGSAVAKGSDPSLNQAAASAFWANLSESNANPNFLTAASNPSSTPANAAVTYDPTNGTVSPGDVYRLKQ